MTLTPETVSFFDPAVNKCPYPAHEVLREQAPVWQDPATGMFVLTRFEDVHDVLMNPTVYTNRVGSAAGMTEKAVRPTDPEELAKFEAAEAEARELAELYETQGWPTTRTLDALDEPVHMQLRRMFSEAFRPARIAELDPFVENLAQRLIDAVIDKGEAEWVQAFAVPLPLYTIGKQMGVPESDMPRIKAWTDAWVQRLGLMQTHEERMWSARQEVEAQNYFQPIFDRLRVEPEDTLLSDLVNKEIPEWGRTLTDNELHSEMMADFFVGGSETTTSALTSGMVMLAERQDVWDMLVADPEGAIPVFIEEVVRLEGPVQTLLRETAIDVELQGVHIPAGSVISLRFGAANRDPRKFSRADELDMGRERPRQHVGYGLGNHVCMGAPLARRELYFGFKAVVERFARIWLPEGRNTFDCQPSYFLRGLKELTVGFEAR